MSPLDLTTEMIRRSGGWRDSDILAKYYGGPLQCKRCDSDMKVVSIRTRKNRRTWRCPKCGARRWLKV